MLSSRAGQPPTPTLSPSGYFEYDNTFYRTSNPVVDYWGILFTLNTTGGPLEGNIYATGPDRYVFYQHDGFWTSISFNIEQVPEPASVALPGAGMLGLAGFGALRWRRRAGRLAA